MSAAVEGQTAAVGIEAIPEEIKNPARPDSVDVDLREIVVTGASTAAMAFIYAGWESGRGPWLAESVTDFVRRQELYGNHADIAVQGAIDAGLARLIGPARVSGDYIQLTPLGIAWVEANCDYCRAGNHWRYKSRFWAVGNFEFDPPRSWTSRIRDPLVAGAAVTGSVIGLLISKVLF